MRYSDEDLLKLVSEERKRSIGFGEGDSGELTTKRTRALEYYRGLMSDVPAAENRSAVVDTTLADAVETALPDLLDVFIGGDDVATFLPQGEEDEARAQQESDYVTHVVMQENDGFLLLHTAIKDGLLVKTGLATWWWETEEKSEPAIEVSAEEAPMLQAIGAQQGRNFETEDRPNGMVALLAKSRKGKLCIANVAPEDFSVAFDAKTNLKNATYCAQRARPRIQELLGKGLDAATVRALNTYEPVDGTVARARDEANESDQSRDGASGDLRVVEIRYHYIRLLTPPETKPKIWKVTTDADEGVLLDKEEVSQIPFAALTPYLVPHRFYGESLDDKLHQIQQLKTAVLRGHMDGLYFGLNQRNEVDMSAANEFTIADLLRNQPGVPVRVARAGAIKAIQAAPLNTDTLATLEYAATMAESRSGIVRNAQGLNPDTLHDTKGGALALIAAAQKRIRLIARVIAETFVKDLWLGVHEALRMGYAQPAEEGQPSLTPATAKLRNSWETIEPASWPERDAMTIHVGVGSAGKEHELMVSTQRLEMMERMVMIPGAQGALIDGSNIHNALTAWERAAGTKEPDRYWTDPATAQPQPPKPDPNMVKAQADIETERMKAKAGADLAREKAAADLQTQRESLAAKAEADREAAINAHALKMTQLSEELDMERQKLAIQLENQREIELIKAKNNHEIGVIKATAPVDQVEAGGEPG